MAARSEGEQEEKELISLTLSYWKGGNSHWLKPLSPQDELWCLRNIHQPDLRKEVVREKTARRDSSSQVHSGGRIGLPTTGGVTI